MIRNILSASTIGRAWHAARPALLAATLLAPALGPTNALASNLIAIGSFNGAVSNEPFDHLTPDVGTGEINVTLSCQPSVDSPNDYPGEECIKTFNEPAAARFDWQNTSGFLDETVVNRTGYGLSRFMVELSNSYEIVADGWTNLPVDAIVTRMTNYIMVDFVTPLATGAQFGFDIDFQAVNGLSFTTITQTPTAMMPQVNEPGLIALFGIGLAGLAFIRRRDA